MGEKKNGFAGGIGFLLSAADSAIGLAALAYSLFFKNTDTGTNAAEEV